MNDNAKSKGSLALAAPRVITIPANDPEIGRKLRVAAYARVSSNSDDQAHSFAAQNAYFSKLIAGNPNWELADIYADKGVTGTSIDKREDFLRMMEDCRKGRVDRILVKSISRFARNTSECLEAIRQFRANGTTIFFEKENIDTARMSSELMTALYAAFAQAESESISGNMRWSYQKRMERGEFNTCSAPLGYDLVNGSLIINEEYAAVVRSIYEMYLRGINTTEITKMLNQSNVLNIHWQRGRIEYILRNESYIGDAQLQKKYTTDTLPRKRMRNSGEHNSYYVIGIHDEIIPQDWFERVQRLFKSREKTVSVEKTPFHGRIQCSCGAACRSKRSTSARYWLCMRHDGDAAACPITQIPETQIQQAFLRLYYNLKHQGSCILPDLIANLRSIRERKFLWSVDVIELNRQIAELTSQNQLLTTLRESGCVDPDIFISKSNKLTEQLRAVKQAKSRILNQDGDDTIPCTQELITILKRGPETLHDFDGELFGQLIDKVIIESNTSLRFRLKNGLELRESIERTVR